MKNGPARCSGFRSSSYSSSAWPSPPAASCLKPVRCYTAKMSRRTKFLLLPIPIILVLCVGAYLGRAWLRSSVIPAYVNVTYRPFFKHRFASGFTPVNGLLKEMNAYSGIDPKAEDGTGDVPPCSFVSYSGFYETVL